MGGKVITTTFGENAPHSYDLYYHRAPSCRYTTAECLATWTAFRPPTNCDDPDIIRAREFLYQRRALLYSQRSVNKDGAVKDSDLVALDEHHVPLQDMYFDPISRSVIDDAAVVLHHAYLEYWTEESAGGQDVTASTASSRRQAIGGGHTKNRSIRVPCVHYSVDIESYLPSSERLDHKKSPLPDPQFEEMGSVSARLHPSDLICILDNSYTSPHTRDSFPSSSQQWHVVLRVDLLFARVLVQKCKAPPLQWLEPSLLSTEDRGGGRCWMAMSKLWRVIVCSKQHAEGMEAVSTKYIR